MCVFLLVQGDLRCWRSWDSLCNTMWQGRGHLTTYCSTFQTHGTTPLSRHLVATKFSLLEGCCCIKSKNGWDELRFFWEFVFGVCVLLMEFVICNNIVDISVQRVGGLSFSFGCCSLKWHDPFTWQFMNWLLHPSFNFHSNHQLGNFAINFSVMN